MILYLFCLNLSFNQLINSFGSAHLLILLVRIYLWVYWVKFCCNIEARTKKTLYFKSTSSLLCDLVCNQVKLLS